MDTLEIQALKMTTKIGIHAWEQQINQQLLIDITIRSNFSKCHDSIENTIDYDALCKTVTDFVESKSFQLIETVAHEVADLVQQEFKTDQLTIAVSKPHAVKNAATVRVVVNR